MLLQNGFVSEEGWLEWAQQCQNSESTNSDSWMQWEGQDEASLRRHWQVELARRSGMSGIDMKERAFGLVLGLGPETGDRVKSRET